MGQRSGDKEYIMIAKGFGTGWRLWNANSLTNFLARQVAESDISERTDLLLFSEYDDETYDYFMEKGNLVIV